MQSKWLFEGPMRDLRLTILLLLVGCATANSATQNTFLLDSGGVVFKGKVIVPLMENLKDGGDDFPDDDYDGFSLKPVMNAVKTIKKSEEISLYTTIDEPFFIFRPIMRPILFSSDSILLGSYCEKPVKFHVPNILRGPAATADLTAKKYIAKESKKTLTVQIYKDSIQIYLRPDKSKPDQSRIFNKPFSSNDEFSRILRDIPEALKKILDDSQKSTYIYIDPHSQTSINNVLKLCNSFKEISSKFEFHILGVFVP